RSVITKPGSRLVNDALLHTQIDNFTFPGNPCTVHDVELGLLKRWRHLIFYHFDTGLIANDLVRLLDGSDASNIQANRGIKLQCVATRGGFRATKQTTNLHANLVDEKHH